MDLIDRSDLLHHLDECIAEGDAQTPITNAVLTAIKCAVEQMPTVDAVPVRHGRWIGGGYYKCSVCSSFEFVRTDYCRWCGTKMDEEETE